MAQVFVVARVKSIQIIEGDDVDSGWKKHTSPKESLENSTVNKKKQQRTEESQ